MADTMTLCATLEELMEKYKLPEEFKFDFINVEAEDFKTFRIQLKPKSAKKAPKGDHLEDVTLAEEKDDLKKATVETLRAYCTSKGLKVGGNKKDIITRVWTSLQGKTTESDMSPKNRKKKEVEKEERHTCVAHTKAGKQCSGVGEHEHERDGHTYHLCWRHTKKADEVLDQITGHVTPTNSDTEMDEATPSTSTPPSPKPKPKVKRVVKKKKEAPATPPPEILEEEE